VFPGAPVYHGPFIVKPPPGRVIEISIFVKDIKIIVTIVSVTL
jgi:hypothetical protein